MSDDLVERVARALEKNSYSGKASTLMLARAAIAVVLDEAAKVVEFSPESHTAREMQLMQNKAAAIRAMIPKET